MQIPVEIISALIGAVSAIIVIVIKEALIDTLQRRLDRRHELLKKRLEKAYTPLNYYLYTLVTCEAQDKSVLQSETLEIIKQYGYLLSDKTLSGFYILLDRLMELDGQFVEDFLEEYRLLKERYYKGHSSSVTLD